MELRQRKAKIDRKQILEGNMGMDNGDKLDSHTLIIENEKLQRDLQEMRKRVIRLEQQREQQQQPHRANVGSSKNQIQTCDSDAATLDKRDTQDSNDATNREIETEDIESGQQSCQEIVSLIPDDTSAGAPLHHGKNDIVDEDAGDANTSHSFGRMVMDRAGWLVGLLVLQSMSSFIIQRNEIMLQKHLVIVRYVFFENGFTNIFYSLYAGRFLTMLVGAGGNAGNQASVRGPCWTLLHMNYIFFPSLVLFLFFSDSRFSCGNNSSRLCFSFLTE